MVERRRKGSQLSLEESSSSLNRLGKTIITVTHEAEEKVDQPLQAEALLTSNRG
ncbi:MAG TPA: hypothetical protein VG944_04095 [Fimbriimonas sp.]|nr:hypothetical protein [Fimbriimonas sp.]